MKYRHSIFLVTCTEHACEVSNYCLPGISLRPVVAPKGAIVLFFIFED